MEIEDNDYSESAFTESDNDTHSVYDIEDMSSEAVSNKSRKYDGILPIG